MNSVEETVEGIRLLIAGGDLSDSVHLRQLHKACLQAFKDLNSNLAKCRSLVENGSIQAARELNCSFDPSLTQVAETLEFFKTNDFFAICAGYGLETPVFPDEQLLQVLNAPISSGEKRLHALLQDYRKIARNGTMQQRIALLRQIVRKLPNSARWRNDLISAERSRCQEIERDMKQFAGKPECCREMEELYREVMTPEWLLPPKAELTEELRRQLLPLQQARLNKEAEDRLQLLSDCWAERDTLRLAEEFEKWRVFCSNPIVRLSNEQKQTVSAIESFLKNSEEERKIEEIGQELIRKIEQKLSDNAPFSEVVGEYNQLQVMDYPIPTALEDRLKALEEESARCDYLRNVRWCIFGISGAVLLIVIIVFSVLHMQHYLAVKRNVSNMQELADQKRYDEVLKIYGDLKVSSPKVAGEPQIILLKTRAEEARNKLLTDQRQQKEDFKRLLQQMEQLSQTDVLDNAAALDKVIAEARKLKDTGFQEKKDLDRFSELETRVTRRRTELKQKMEKDFLDFCGGAIAKGNELILQIPQKTPEELDVQMALLKRKFEDKFSASPYVPRHLKDREKKKFQAVETRYGEAWKKEKAFRLVRAPENFESYARDLEKIRYEYPDLAQAYDPAFARLKEWQKEYENYKNFIPVLLEDVHDANAYGSGLFSEDLKRILPKTTRSAAFAKFFSDIQKQKDLKELVLTAPDAKPYFFYIPGQVLVEKLRNPPRTNITFVANPAENEKNSRIILSFNEKNAKTPFTLISRHPDLPYKLPPAFALLAGKSELPQEICHPWPGAELAGRYGVLNNDGPGLNANLREALKFICGDGHMENIYLKEMFLLYFLQELFETSPQLYPEVADALQRLQEFQHRHPRNWRAPQICDEYEQDKPQLEQLWAQLDVNRFLEAGKLRGDFVCSAHARRLIPVGVLQETGQDKIRVHLFAGVKPPKEGLVFEQKTVRILPNEVWSGAMPRDKKWRGLLFNGQVIWSFADGMSSVEFLRTWEQKALRLNIRLKIKPAILPVGLNL